MRNTEMAEHRKFTHAICVKTDAKTEAKYELFPAEQWDGPAGCFRIRYNRCWLDKVMGTARYMPPKQLGALIASAITGEPFDMPEPTLPKGTLVRVRRVPADPLTCQRVFTKTDPWRGWDGRWYVQVRIYGRGDVMMPVEQCEVILNKEKQ
jgi:hypothetical protein